MLSGFDTVKDVLQVALSSIAVFAFVVAIFSYFNSRDQFGFTVIVRCVERFQKILPELESLDKKSEQQKDRIIRQYIDLCEEELFYFKK